MATYTVLVYESEPDEEVKYWASVAELPGCFTMGQTIEEVEENAKDAIDVYLHAQEWAGKETSQAPPHVVRTLQVSVA
jgi:predicted RNase H-like HicB family nuclease